MCFLFSHEYADILKTIVDVESFQYKECILLFREVVEPVVFLLSQNLWLIREVRSDCLKKCRNYVKVTVYAWRILVWNQGYGQRSPIRSCSADEASPERAESWEYEVEGLSKVILGGWSWAQVILFSFFFFFCSWKEKYYLFKCTCALAHTCAHTHTPFFRLYKEWNYCPKRPPKVQNTQPFDRSSAKWVREAFPRIHFFKSYVSCLFISILFWKK